jgi:hypothetical protein
VTHPVIERRRRERAASIARVKSWADGLATRLHSLQTVAVFGSVARGDFNKWSDIDVLVVAADLPERYAERAELVSPVPPGVQPIIWTPEELAHQRRRGNPIAREVDEIGVVVVSGAPSG